MLRYYVTSRDVWQGPHDFGGVLLPRYNLFHTIRGSHYLNLTDNLILVSTDFDIAENEQAWHNQFHVGRLPHPVHEYDVPLSHLHQKTDWTHKRYFAHYHEALKSVVGIEDHHTVWDLHDKAILIHPLVKLDEVY